MVTVVSWPFNPEIWRSDFHKQHQQCSPQPAHGEAESRNVPTFPRAKAPNTTDVNGNKRYLGLEKCMSLGKPSPASQIKSCFWKQRLEKARWVIPSRHLTASPPLPSARASARRTPVPRCRLWVSFCQYRAGFLHQIPSLSSFVLAFHACLSMGTRSRIAANCHLKIWCLLFWDSAVINSNQPKQSLSLQMPHTLHGYQASPLRQPTEEPRTPKLVMFFGVS